ncbi:MAG: ABC transporter permease [Pseudorhodoferax sp.]
MTAILRLGYRTLVVAVPVFLLLPFVGVVLASLSPQGALNFPPQGFSLQWYRSIDPSYFEALWYSVRLATASTLLVVLLGVPAAVVIARSRSRYVAPLNAMLLAPLAVPSIVVAVAGFKFALLAQDGTGLALNGSSTAIVLLQGVMTLPIVVRTVVASFAHYDVAIDEAAQSLGATPLYAFWRITLPALVPGIAAGAIFAFVLSFDDMVIAWFIGNPAELTLPVKLFTSIEVEFDNAITALSTLIVAAWAVLLLVLSRFLRLDRAGPFGR